MCPKMGHKWGTKWGTKEGAEVNLLVKDGDIGFLCAPNGAQKLCAPNGAQMGHKMGHKMGCRGLKSKNYTIIEFNENLKLKIFR